MGGAIGTTSASLFQSMPMKLLPTKKVLRRMRDHMLPNERVLILEGLTELNNRARRPLLLGDAAVIEIVRGGGVELVVDAMRLYQDWDPLLSMAMQLLCPLCRHDDTIRRLLEHDGHFVIQKVVREQETDSFIREDGREIIEAINVQGAMLTLNLIRDVITDMCYCDTCRPLAEVRRVCAHYGGGSSGAKEGEGDVAMIRLQRLIDPTAYDIQRKERDVAAVRLLAQSMADFAKSSRVQEAGADGLIAFAREGATRSYLLKDPEVVKALGKALRTAVDNFPLNPAVLWKAMRATHLLSANEALCVELVKVGMIPQALRVFKSSDDADVKQEAIWALSEMSRSIMGRDVIEEGPGWKVLHQILKAQEKGRRDDSVVLPMQLKMLFTREKYKELFKLDKSDEKVQQEERKQQKQARVETESAVKTLLHRTAKPKFGTVDERLHATTASPEVDPEVTTRSSKATLATSTRGSINGQSLRKGPMSRTSKTVPTSTISRMDESGPLNVTSTFKGTARGGAQYPALMAPAAD